MKVTFEDNGQGWERTDGFEIKGETEEQARFQEILSRFPNITKEDRDFLANLDFVVLDGKLYEFSKREGER